MWVCALLAIAVLASVLVGASSSAAQEPGAGRERPVEIVLNSGQKFSVHSIVVSEDGKLIVTGSGENTAVTCSGSSAAGSSSGHLRRGIDR